MSQVQDGVGRLASMELRDRLGNLAAFGVAAVTWALVGIVVTTRDPLRQTLVAGLYGLALAVLMVVLQAPDVALSEIVVSSVASPFILLTALAKLQRRRTRK